MSSRNGHGFPWRIDISVAVRGSLRRLLRRASEQGQGQDLLAALREAVARLERDPLEFGEPLYRLPALGLEIRSAAVRPIVIDFGVNVAHRLVIIKGVKLLLP